LADGFLAKWTSYLLSRVELVIGSVLDKIDVGEATLTWDERECHTLAINY